MAVNVLNSPEAIRMSVFVVRAFVKMRQALVRYFEIQGARDQEAVPACRRELSFDFLRTLRIFEGLLPMRLG